LLVGDAMSSLSLIEPNLDADLLTVAKVGDRYTEMPLSRAADNWLHLCQDLKPLWLTSIGAIGDTHFVGADVRSF
jgi:hypothetical protein